jgi:3-hydroxyisobutyrate dehydrogenase-like beta-hydroxyacid dehydrogenase
MATEIEPTQKIGRMGTAIAKNVLKSGFKVTVFNRSESKTTPLVELGAIKAV